MKKTFEYVVLNNTLLRVIKDKLGNFLKNKTCIILITYSLIVLSYFKYVDDDNLSSSFCSSFLGDSSLLETVTHVND